MNDRGLSDIQSIKGENVLGVNSSMFEKWGERIESIPNKMTINWNEIPGVEVTISTQKDIYKEDSKIHKKNEQYSIIKFLKKLERYSYVYKNLTDEKLRNNLDFSKLCMSINPNVYPYLIKEHQDNQEIIDFVNGLTLKDCPSLNFIYSAKGIPFIDRFRPYLDHYEQEVKQLSDKQDVEM